MGKKAGTKAQTKKKKQTSKSRSEDEESDLGGFIVNNSELDSEDEGSGDDYVIEGSDSEDEDMNEEVSSKQTRKKNSKRKKDAKTKSNDKVDTEKVASNPMATSKRKWNALEEEFAICECVGLEPKGRDYVGNIL